MDTETIKAWDNSTNMPQMIAADLAIQIFGGRINDLPSNKSLAHEWDTSETSAKRAKRLLAKHEVIKKDEKRRYYIPGDVRSVLISK